MIERQISAHFGGGGNSATLSDKGLVMLSLYGHDTLMTEAEARRLWSNLGTLLRESAKWNG